MSTDLTSDVSDHVFTAATMTGAVVGAVWAATTGAALAAWSVAALGVVGAAFGGLVMAVLVAKLIGPVWSTQLPGSSPSDTQASRMYRSR